MSDYFKQSVDQHRNTQGKFLIGSKSPLQTRDDLSIAYTPGVAVLSDGSSVLGLGNIGPEAALSVMEGKAHAAGAAVVGTGRSDFPNQVNNVLVFPGLFRGALDVQARSITDHMKMAAVDALASSVKTLTANCILPNPLDKSVAPKIAQAVAQAAIEDGVAQTS